MKNQNNDLENMVHKEFENFQNGKEHLYEYVQN